MKTVILAAGQWKRLLPLTQDKAKPMIEILNKPILEHILDKLIWLTDEITIIVKYKKEQIIDFFGEEFKWIKIKYQEQSDKKWTWWALIWLKLQEDFVLLNGDTIYDRKDLENLYGLKWYGCLVKKVDDPSKYGIFEVKNWNFAKQIIEKPQDFVWDLANMWVYKFPLSIIKIVENIPISARWEYEVTDAINELLQKINFQLVWQKWDFIDIGYPEDVEKAEKILKNK